MKQLKLLAGALFRPKPSFAALSEGAKWVWLPALGVLLGAALANAVVSAPLQVTANIEFANRQMVEQNAKEGGPADSKGRTMPAPSRTSSPGGAEMSEKEAKAAREAAESDLIEPGTEADAGAIPMAVTVGVVFGAVGVIASLLTTALFFFVAGKVWAKRVTFPVYVSMTSLAFLPLALRDLLQAGYQTATGNWIQHQGISSLVAAKDTLSQGGLAYGLLSQVDVWTLWALALLLVGAQAAAGFEKKRALTAMGVFVVVAGLLRAAPAMVTGAFMGMGG